jgi:hypothetical protein
MLVEQEISSVFLTSVGQQIMLIMILAYNRSPTIPTLDGAEHCPTRDRSCTTRLNHSTFVINSHVGDLHHSTLITHGIRGYYAYV